MSHKDLRKLIKALESEGYTVRKTKKQHYEVRDTQGFRVTTLPGTPSDHRTMKNSLAPLKRRGFQWPPR